MCNSVFGFMRRRTFSLCEREAAVWVYVHECMRAFVRVLRASIMYLDNATASLYREQLTGLPTQTREGNVKDKKGVRR